MCYSTTKPVAYDMTAQGPSSFCHRPTSCGAPRIAKKRGNGREETETKTKTRKRRKRRRGIQKN